MIVPRFISSIRRHLGRELRSRRVLLARLRAADPCFAPFPRWAAVDRALSRLTRVVRQRVPRVGDSRILHRVTRAIERQDALLGGIVRQWRRDGDRRWPVVLVTLCWPLLAHFERRFRSSQPDREERWQDVFCAFHQSLHRLDVEQRQARLWAKLFHDTRHDLSELYWQARQDGLRQRSRCSLEVVAEPWVAEDPGFGEVEYRDELAALERRCRQCQRAGRLTAAEAELVVAMEVRGWSLAGYAREHGLSYEAAKKRRQRALAVLRRHAG